MRYAVQSPDGDFAVMDIPDDEDIAWQAQDGDRVAVVPDGADIFGATHYVTGGDVISHPMPMDYDMGSIVLRPEPPAPPALTAGVAATWAGLPPGAVVRVFDTAGAAPVEMGSDSADAAGDLEITLPEAGPWRLAVDALWPHRAAVFDIEVAA